MQNLHIRIPEWHALKPTSPTGVARRQILPTYTGTLE